MFFMNFKSDLKQSFGSKFTLTDLEVGWKVEFCFIREPACVQFIDALYKQTDLRLCFSSCLNESFTLSLFTQPHVLPNLHHLCFAEHKWRYFETILVTIDIHCMKRKKRHWSISQNIFFHVPQKKVSRACLERHQVE